MYLVLAVQQIKAADVFGTGVLPPEVKLRFLIEYRVVLKNQ
jgi:hypothetical protein